MIFFGLCLFKSTTRIGTSTSVSKRNCLVTQQRDRRRTLVPIDSDPKSKPARTTTRATASKHRKPSKERVETKGVRRKGGSLDAEVLQPQSDRNIRWTYRGLFWGISKINSRRWHKNRVRGQNSWKREVHPQTSRKASDPRCRNQEAREESRLWVQRRWRNRNNSEQINFRPKRSEKL